MKLKKLVAALLSAAVAAACCGALFGCSKGDTGGTVTPVADDTDDNYRAFYQIFVCSFSDSNGDGVGDLRGIINRLDYLNDGNINSETSLGVQSIWLSPIFSSPSYHKYDATSYENIDYDYGTEADLVELVEKCHERNVKVILDLAINHTSTSHSWFSAFKQAIKDGDTNNEYYDYYVHVSKEDQVSGRTYQLISGTTDQYYECNFSTDMPELNYDNDVVKDRMVEVARKWLDLGVDGFRFDAIKYIYYGDEVKNAEFWEWYMDELREIKSDIYAVGECWSADSTVINYYNALNCFDFDTSQQGHIYQAALQGKIAAFTSKVESWQKKIKEKTDRADAMYCPFIANHDTDRAAGYLTITSGNAYVAANLYMLCCGSPFIYYGEEIGMKGSRGSANTDANRRLAMRWGDGDTVKNPTGSTYSVSYQTNGTVVEQLEDSSSLLHHYRKLIDLRQKYPEIPRGDYESLIITSDVAGFKVTYNGQTTYILHNVSTEEQQVTLPEGVTGELKNYIGLNTAALSGTTLTIGAQTSVIIK